MLVKESMQALSFVSEWQETDRVNDSLHHFEGTFEQQAGLTAALYQLLAFTFIQDAMVFLSAKALELFKKIVCIIGHDELKAPTGTQQSNMPLGPLPLPMTYILQSFLGTAERCGYTWRYNAR